MARTLWAVLWCRGGDVKWGQAGTAGAGPGLSSLLSPLDLRQEGLWPVAARTAQNVPVHCGKTGGGQDQVNLQDNSA